MKVVFLTNGGGSIGIGHVRRCLSLGQAVRDRRDEASFYVNPEAAVLDMIRSCGFPVVGIDGDLADAVGILASVKPDVIVADSYALEDSNLGSLARIGRLLVIDDLADREFPADIVLNSAPHADRAMYRALPSTKFLLGPSYALLRPEFIGIPERHIGKDVLRVIVTLGGSDPRELTGRLVRSARAAFPEVSFDVVRGPFFLDKTGSDGEGISFHDAPEAMRDLMLAADVAVTGGGQTTYELAATGTPGLIVTMADNQVPQSRAWDAAGVFRYVGDSRDDDVTANVVEALRALASDPSRRADLSRRGRSMVDGLGARRVAMEIS